MQPSRTGARSSASAPSSRRRRWRPGSRPWLAPPNENNDLLRRGAAQLGIPAATIQRNVKGCWNLGSCGLGCPTNAKQSMLVTTIPAALDRGARLLVETRAHKLVKRGGRIEALECVAVSPIGEPSSSEVLRIEARHFVVAGGAINSPALLLRSDLPDPHGTLGRRTFLHPVVISAAVFDQKVEGWTGAPQTIYTDHFLETDPIDGPIGYKLEAPPIHPILFASTVSGFGPEMARQFAAFPHTHALLALLRDGFHPQAPGGRVTLRGDGSPVLDYPLTDFVMDGAREVVPAHERALSYKRWADAKRAIEQLPMRPHLTRVASAHVMGGCGMAGDEKRGVVRPDGRHWQVENLSVHDGSLFPTSIGANPQLSIYGLVNRLATGLGKELSGREVRLAA
jgi:choline dehydrogenase-like flavoprotein